MLAIPASVVSAFGMMWALNFTYSQRDVMLELRRRFRAFRDIRTQVRNIPGFNIGGGTFDIDLALRGPELERLAEYGAALKERARAIPGIVDADTTLQLDKPELRVVIDRERAADLRVDTAQIATALRLMVGGDDQVSRFRDPSVNDDYDVQIRLMDAYRGDLGTISRLYVSRDSASNNPATGAANQVGMAPAGGLVRLDNVVRIERRSRPPVSTAPIGSARCACAPRSRPASARPTGSRRSSRPSPR